MQENLTPHACAVTDRTFSFSDVPSALERLAKKSPSSKLLFEAIPDGWVQPLDCKSNQPGRVVKAVLQ
jgi:hypothetical protein